MKKYAERSKAKKKNTEKLKEGLKSSILGPQNLGSGGARAPRAPPGSASVSVSILDLPADNSIPSEGYRSTLSTGCPCCTVRTLDLPRVSYIFTV